MNILEIDFRNLELDSVGNWPLVIRRTLLFLIFVVVLGIGYVEDIGDLLTQYSDQVKKISDLKYKYEDAHNKVSNLKAYKEQMKEIQKIFDTLKKQLPAMQNSISNDAALLEEISQQSFISGLKFKYMKPNPIVEKGFYLEYPIELSVSGTYHNIGEFLSNVSNMPRIVTFHDFILTLANPDKAEQEIAVSKGNFDPELSMNVKAQTYWAMNSLE
jgi:type IV pilus assembly protein PilO